MRFDNFIFGKKWIATKYMDKDGNPVQRSYFPCEIRFATDILSLLVFHDDHGDEEILDFEFHDLIIEEEHRIVNLKSTNELRWKVNMPDGTECILIGSTIHGNYMIKEDKTVTS